MAEAHTILIRGALAVDPSDGSAAGRDLLVRDGLVARAGGPLPRGARVIDAAGLVLVPGFVDLHVHLREPGREEAETVATGTAAAAAGGFTRVVAMPNTEPPADAPDRLRDTLRRAARAGHARVLPSACLTRARSGREPSDLAALAEAGAACFTDDGATVADDAVMRACMDEARRLGRVVMDHAQDTAAERAGVMHEGAASRRFGLPGIPADAEARVIERDIRLARETGCALHVQHLTSARGVDLVRAARREGLPVSAEATPHHLALCDDDVDPADANYKMNPPLRSAADRGALVDAVCAGDISCLATDHAPHPAAAKAAGFLEAPFGVVGLETAVGVSYTLLVRSGRMPLPAWVRRWTTAPCAVLGLPPPSLAEGAPADLALLDLESEWTVDPRRFRSRSRNTPFAGRALRGRAVFVLCAGRVVHDAPFRTAAPGGPGGA